MARFDICRDHYDVMIRKNNDVILLYRKIRGPTSIKISYVIPSPMAGFYKDCRFQHQKIYLFNGNFNYLHVISGLARSFSITSAALRYEGILQRAMQKFGHEKYAEIFGISNIPHFSAFEFNVG